MDAFYQPLNGNLLVCKNLSEFFFQRIDLCSFRCLPGLLHQNFVVKYRRLIEQIKNKYQHTNEKDNKLHGDFEQAVEDQPEPAFSKGFATQVSCYLRLISSKVGQEKKSGSQQTRPNVVSVAPTKIGSNNIQFSQLTGNANRIKK